MKLGFRANMSKQKPSLCKGSKNVTQIQKSMASSSQLKSEAVFFYCEGIIHHIFLPCGQTMNKELSEGDEKVERGSEEKKAWFVEGKKLVLHHYNTMAHSSLLIHDFITKHETTLIPQPPYSPPLHQPTSLHQAEIHNERMTIGVFRGV